MEQINPKIVKVQQPQLRLNYEKIFTAVKGAKTSGYRIFNATAPSDTALTFNCNPPLKNIFSRFVLLNMQFSGSVNAVTSDPGYPGANTKVIQSGYFAPRSFPLHSIIDSISVNIGSATSSQSGMKNYWPALMNYDNYFDSRSGLYSQCPSYMDQYQNYSDGLSQPRNVLGEYGFTVYEDGRGSFTGFKVLTNPFLVGNSVSTATFTLDITQPLMVSPFVFGNDHEDKPGIYNVETMIISIATSTLERLISMISSFPGVTPGSTVTVSTPIIHETAAQLQFIWYEPDPIATIPKQLILPHYEVQVQSILLGNLAPNQTLTATISAINLKEIPIKIFCFAQVSDNSRGPVTSDTFGYLANLRMSWDSADYFLQQTPQQLYQMCSENGLTRSWNQFRGLITVPSPAGAFSVANSIVGTVGSVVCIDTSKDIGLRSDEAPSTRVTHTMQLSADVTNVNQTQTQNMTFYVVIVYDGIMVNDNGRIEFRTGVISPEQVLSAPLEEKLFYHRTRQLMGGNIFSSIKSFFKNPLEKLKTIAPVVSEIAKIIPVPGVSQAVETARKVLGVGAKKKRVTYSDAVRGGCSSCGEMPHRCRCPFQDYE